jgi:hypothetical protein
MFTAGQTVRFAPSCVGVANPPTSGTLLRVAHYFPTMWEVQVASGVGYDMIVTLHESMLAPDDAHPIHCDECTCDECTARFDDVMWGWLTPAHMKVVNDYWSDDPDTNANLHA